MNVWLQLILFLWNSKSNSLRTKPNCIIKEYLWGPICTQCTQCQHCLENIMIVIVHKLCHFQTVYGMIFAKKQGVAQLHDNYYIF